MIPEAHPKTSDLAPEVLGDFPYCLHAALWAFDHRSPSGWAV